MREIYLLFLLLPSLLANEFHVHSLKHVQKRHDIPLEFIMNSQEHSDIRRSVHLEKDDENLERLSSDKFVVRRDEVPSKDSSSEVQGGDADSVPDKFDQSSYDFMLPEGKSENSTILAVVDFITRKHNAKPTFIVNFDENQWFDIGNVEKTRADNADVYKATVILRAMANVEMGKTEGGSYRFVVEAQQGEVVLATTNISVDVINLGPTTVSRKRVTVPSEPKTSTVEPIATTSEASTSSDDVLTIGGSDDDLTTPLSVTTTEEEEEEEVEVLDSESSGEGSGESSGDGLLSSLDATSSDSESTSPSDPEDPITGPLTILPLQNSPDGDLIPLDIHLTLSPDTPIQIPRTARPGDLIRDVHVEFHQKTSSPIELSIEPEGLLEIRPHLIFPGEPAALFLLHPFPEAPGTLELIGKVQNSTTIRTPIQMTFPVDSEVVEGSEMLSLREVEFGVMETAESGRTIGQVDGDLKIIGGNGNRRFSLVGSDLILSCGQFDTEKCLQNDPQKNFSLILMPKNGELKPVQVTISVQQQASLRTSDKVLRISDNRIISPFAVVTERTRKTIKLDGDAAKFLDFLKVQEGLYQVISWDPREIERWG
uniref:Cadherin domain-containing protein n=1 Tax=Caenorhabditis tropicalis TaxID=1561998 RepID=A0A1I7TQD8_9PELO